MYNIFTIMWPFFCNIVDDTIEHSREYCISMLSKQNYDNLMFNIGTC